DGCPLASLGIRPWRWRTRRRNQEVHSGCLWQTDARTGQERREQVAASSQERRRPAARKNRGTVCVGLFILGFSNGIYEKIIEAIARGTVGSAIWILLEFACSSGPAGVLGSVRKTRRRRQLRSRRGALGAY